MSVLTVLYTLFIAPLELFFEIIFVVANSVIDNPGLSIIFLSLAMNFLVLPLYRRADQMQEEERKTEERLGHWVKHIKKTFKGDERFMMLQTYYRQNNYKPTDALKGSVSLLLEIPFFIAAFHFLSTLPILQGVSFGPIADLGAPDAMLTIFGVSINVLPILMTAINIVSGAIYAKGLPTRAKVQIYGMAAIFLVLLYQSPAGLVFYWTLNNVFSLVKNIFYKLKNPGFVLSVLSSLTGFVCLVWVVLNPIGGLRTQLIVITLLLMLQLPLVSHFAKKRMTIKPLPEATKTDITIFRVACLFMAVLLGVLIPISVVSSSPLEFINPTTMMNPLLYVVQCALLAVGVFVIWMGVFFSLANEKGKYVMSIVMFVICGVSVVNYMMFGTDYGLLSSKLVYESGVIIPAADILINAGVLAVVILAFVMLFKKKRELAKFALGVAALAVFAMAAINIPGIQSSIEGRVQTADADPAELSIPLSKDHENVVVLMMDRGIGTYIPYLWQENPELAQKFDGFTYYENTVSYGSHTRFGLPGLFGGYEYTPAEMDKRDDELLVDKHIEALKLMPSIFDKAGYDVTFFDPTYAGYQEIPDLHVFDDMPDIHVANTKGVFNDSEQARYDDAHMGEKFFCFGMFKCAPLLLQPALYQDGEYNLAQGFVGKELASSVFMNSYSTLLALPEISKVTEGGQGTFFAMCNESPHSPTVLGMPSYKPEGAEFDDISQYFIGNDDYVVDGQQLNFTNKRQVMHYQINMASYNALGEWFDWMRANDVYDNTRIIVVSDHGFQLQQLADFSLKSTPEDVDLMAYCPVLMVKDFNAHGFTTDDTFMTNADVPLLATEGLIQNPVNPFTGNPLTDQMKHDEQILISSCHQIDVEASSGSQFPKDGWLTYNGEGLYNPDNWEVLEPNVSKWR